MKTRMYCIVNQYMAGIHAGIQSAHAIAELLTVYNNSLRPTSKACQLTDQWAKKDKTIIVLNGGYQSRLEALTYQLMTQDSYPHASFREEDDALNGAMTAVAVILPEYMYAPQYLETAVVSGHRPVPEIANAYRDELGNTVHNYTQPEKDLIAVIKSFRLKGE